MHQLQSPSRMQLLVLYAGVMIALMVSASLQDTDSPGQEADGQTTETEPADDDVPDREQVDRRNPRRTTGQTQRQGGPRLAAGGISIGGSTLRWYRPLEALVGSFTFEGESWRGASRPPATFSGTWTNAWALNGQYLRSTFRIGDDDDGYRAEGLMCYDIGHRRFEAHFFNSNSSIRTIRHGHFDDEYNTLEMFSRNSTEGFTNEVDSKIVIEIIDPNHFTYTGYAYQDDGSWQQTYTISCTRVESQWVDRDTERVEDDTNAVKPGS